MKIPARCTIRSCQTRRNLSKWPENYIEWPKCKVTGCTGKMRVDKYRLRREEKDRGRTCHLDCLPYPHRINSPGCVQKQDHILDMSLKDLPHQPNAQQCDW